MNYQNIYNHLILNRRLNKIDRTKENLNVEYHHIIPVSCGGKNDKRKANYNNEKYNIIGLTLREHFFAHLLLCRIYKTKYGEQSIQYKKMIKAASLMIEYKKYKIKSSKLYEQIKAQAIINQCYKTTTNRTWITNGEQDIFLKPNEKILDGFKIGRTINFTEQKKIEFSRKIREKAKGRTAWNKGQKGIYSLEYRRKISQHHADVSGQKNGRFGSKSMYNLQTKQKKIIQKNQIQQYLKDGWVFSKNLKVFNNGEIQLLDITCPIGFVKGKLKKKYTDEELEQLHKKRSNAAKNRLKKYGNPAQNKKWIRNTVTNEILLVNKDQIQYYLKNGFILGNGGNTHPNFSIKGRILIYNEQLNKIKYIFPSQLNEYIKQGYKKGKK